MRYWHSSPRRCSYCNSLEHDKRKCAAWSSDAEYLKSMIKMECQIYIDTLIENRFVPTSVLHLKEMDAYIYDHQEGRRAWNSTDVGDLLFTLSRKDNYYRQPFNLSTTEYRRKEWEVSPLNAMAIDGGSQPHWHRTTMAFQDVFERPPELTEAQQDLERCIMNNSYSEDRCEFMELLNNLIDTYRHMSNDGEIYRLKTEKIEVVSSVNKKGAEDYYNGIHYKLRKNSIDRFLEEWYKHYNSKIKDNHFQK